MANEIPTGFQMPPEMRAIAERSVDQARQAIEGFFVATHRALDTMQGQTANAQANAKDVTVKAVGFAERNVAASFDYAKNLSQAKTPQDMVEIHTTFVRSQMEAFPRTGAEPWAGHRRGGTKCRQGRREATTKPT